MPTIVLSYRRDDARGVAGRIFDRLVTQYGKNDVFMDVDTIPPGEDFRHHLWLALDRCDIVLAIIGPNWRGLDASGFGRMADDEDFVRIEIETALRRDIRVIPLLIDGTPMPRPAELPREIANLASRQAVAVDSGVRFHSDMDRLIDAIGSRNDLRNETGAVINLMRRKFLSAPPRDELVRAKYQLDAFLKEYPSNVEALILRDQIAHAIAYEFGARRIHAELVAPARRARSVRRAAPVAAVAIVFVVAFGYFLGWWFAPDRASLAGFTLHTDRNIEGAALTAASVADIPQCAQACRSAPSCAAFSFHKIPDADGRHACPLYGAPVHLLSNDDWISGLRR